MPRKAKRRDAPRDVAAGFAAGIAERKTANEGDDDPGDRNRDRGLADLSHQAEVGLHPRQQQQQENAELGDAVEQRLLLRRGREDGVLRLRPDPAEQGGPEDQAAQELADHGGLADALHHFAQSMADADQERNLDHQQEFGRARGLTPSAASATVTVNRNASPAQTSDWRRLHRMRCFPWKGITDRRGGKFRRLDRAGYPATKNLPTTRRFFRTSEMASGLITASTSLPSSYLPSCRPSSLSWRSFWLSSSPSWPASSSRSSSSPSWRPCVLLHRGLDGFGGGRRGTADCIRCLLDDRLVVADIVPQTLLNGITIAGFQTLSKREAVN